MGAFEEMRDAARAHIAAWKAGDGIPSGVSQRFNVAIYRWVKAGAPGPEGDADVEGVRARYERPTCADCNRADAGVLEECGDYSDSGVASYACAYCLHTFSVALEAREDPAVLALCDDLIAKRAEVEKLRAESADVATATVNPEGAILALRDMAASLAEYWEQLAVACYEASAPPPQIVAPEVRNHYARRDVVALGQHYADHVGAMTAEGLHDKSRIAAELAWRDAQIADLRSRLKEARGEVNTP